MARATTAPAPTTAPPGSQARLPPPIESVWRAPLIPVMLAGTAGLVADRYARIPLTLSLLTAVAALVAWMTTRAGRPTGLSLVYLALTVVALSAAYHHWRQEVYAPDDIGNFATAEPRPARLRAVIEEEPVINWQPVHDVLQSFPRPDPTVAVLQVTHLKQQADWLPVSGRARLSVTGKLPGLHAGDEIEVVGRLAAPHGPANPGDLDYAGFLRDQRIRAQVSVQKTPEGVTRLAEKWPRSFNGWLGVIRGWAQRTLQDALPADVSGVATALLLGEGSTMTSQDWEKYIRTGVIHVLAISGQHLVVLAGFLWLALRVLGIRRRWGAAFVALFLLGYALLAGGRPPVLRSAVMVCASCIGLYLRRPALTANSFALGWLVVGLLNPADLFGGGCLLSFLAVAVLYWGTSRWLRHEPDPLEQLIDQSRPVWLRQLRWLGRQVWVSYVITLVIWLAAAPLVASRYHLISPCGLLIGPPVVLLTSVALLAGFLLLLTAVVCWPLVPVLAWVVRWSLAGCEGLVNLGDRLPGSHWYVGDIPEWWLWVFYVGLLGLLTMQFLHQRWRWVALAGASWLCIGLLAGAAPSRTDELRCTFLAVGHGGCTVIETPDGRTLLYDAGSLGGPDVTRRQIAPFLWSRGIRRIDEVLLSHADLDHFNGIPALLDRFAVGQVTCTPSFADKKNEPVQLTLAVLRKRGVPIRIVHAGDRLSAGTVEMDVLHPPAVGPEGNENTRSLVLLVRHAGHALLLTGDLEGPGLERVMKLPLPHVDILMAPHHGSRSGRIPELAGRLQPELLIACQGPPRWPPHPPDPYAALGERFLGTWPHGAITVRSGQEGMTIETFVTGERRSVGGAARK